MPSARERCCSSSPPRRSSSPAAAAATTAAAAAGGRAPPTSTSSSSRLLGQEEGRVRQARPQARRRRRGRLASPGPVQAPLSGPFQTQGKAKLPSSTSTPPSRARGQTQGGRDLHRRQGLRELPGHGYAVADAVFQQFKAGFEQAPKQSSGKGDDSLATLGIDPRKWLTDAKNAGEAKVGDTDTIKITGGVDVPSCSTTSTRAGEGRGLGVQGSERAADKITDEQKKQVAEAIKDLTSRSTPARTTRSCAAWSSTCIAGPGRRPAAESARRVRPLPARPQRGPGVQGALEHQAARELLAARRLGLGGLGGRRRLRRRDRTRLGRRRLRRGARRSTRPCVEDAGSDIDEGAEVRRRCSAP